MTNKIEIDEENLIYDAKALEALALNLRDILEEKKSKSTQADFKTESEENLQKALLLCSEILKKANFLKSAGELFVELDESISKKILEVCNEHL